MPKRKRPYGYIVSCPRIPHGRFYTTLKKAKNEMYRQMRAGSRESGISEVWDKKLSENMKQSMKKRGLKI